MKNELVCVTLLGLGLLASGCAQRQGPASSTALGAHPVNSVHTSGIWENGIWTNGLLQNGVWQNGLWGNGFIQNGAWFNGSWFNGLWSNGTSANAGTPGAMIFEGVDLLGGRLVRR